MKKYFKAIFFNYFYLVISIIAFLILTPFAIKKMGEEFYGLWSILTSIMLFANIGTFGIGTIVNKYSAESNIKEDKNYFGKVIISSLVFVIPISIITTVIIFFSANLIPNFYNLNNLFETDLINAIKICSLGIIPQFLIKIPEGFFYSQYKNEKAQLLSLLSSLLPWLGALLIVSFEKKLSYIAIWYVIVQVVILLLYIILINKEISWSVKPDFFLIKKMKNFSLSMFLEMISIAIFQQFDKIVVGAILGPLVVGVYSIGTSLGLRISILAGQITSILIPYSSEKFKNNKNQVLYTNLRFLSKITSLLIFLVGGILLIWMKEVVSIWISNDYAQNFSINFQIIVLAYCFLGISRVGHQTLQGIGDIKFSSRIYFITSIGLILLIIILSNYLDFIGVSIAQFSSIILMIYNIRAYNKLNNGHNFIGHFISDFYLVFLLPFIVVFQIFDNNMLLKIIQTIILLFVFIIFIIKNVDTFSKYLNKKLLQF